jgi:cysteine desulfurase
MWVNNETGVLQPVEEAARMWQRRGILFHTDAVQAIGRLPPPLEAAPFDSLALSGHKFGAPPGVGALIARRGAALWPLVPGHQEGGLRGGTPNVLGAEALAVALKSAQGAAPESLARVRALRDRFEREVEGALSHVRVNGTAPRVGNTSNLCFEGADGEALLIGLDLEGIHVSNGAACASGSARPSHVLMAMGLSASAAQSALRFSLGPDTTEQEVDQVVAALKRLVPMARRRISPLPD